MRLSDGHFVAEEVVTDTAEVFRYVVWGFTSCRCIAVHHAVGTFTFDGDAERARLTWTSRSGPRPRCCGRC